jgi:hypothetical protein
MFFINTNLLVLDPDPTFKMFVAVSDPFFLLTNYFKDVFMASITNFSQFTYFFITFWSKLLIF